MNLITVHVNYKLNVKSDKSLLTTTPLGRRFASLQTDDAFDALTGLTCEWPRRTTSQRSPPLDLRRELQP